MDGAGTFFFNLFPSNSSFSSFPFCLYTTASGLAPREKLFRAQGYVGRCLAVRPCYPAKHAVLEGPADAGTHHLGTDSSSSGGFLPLFSFFFFYFILNFNNKPEFRTDCRHSFVVSFSSQFLLLFRFAATAKQKGRERPRLFRQTKPRKNEIVFLFCFLAVGNVQSTREGSRRKMERDELVTIFSRLATIVFRCCCFGRRRVRMTVVKRRKTTQ